MQAFTDFEAGRCAYANPLFCYVLILTGRPSGQPRQRPRLQPGPRLLKIHLSTQPGFVGLAHQTNPPHRSRLRLEAPGAPRAPDFAAPGFASKKRLAWGQLCYCLSTHDIEFLQAFHVKYNFRWTAGGFIESRMRIDIDASHEKRCVRGQLCYCLEGGWFP